MAAGGLHTGSGFGFVSSTKTRSGFDPFFAQAQLDALNHIFKDKGADYFYRALLVILRKKEDASIESPGMWNRRLVPYRMNRMQRDMRDTMTDKPRNITVKWRQGGSTTHHIIDRLYIPTVLNPGSNGLLISQTRGYAVQHLAILKRVHKHFGRLNPFAWDMDEPKVNFHAHLLHTQFSSRHELVFDFLDGKVMIESAENPEAGQGITMHHVVATEVARWPGQPEETLANLKEAIVPGGTLDIESTPNGMGGYFFEEWERARDWPKAEFQPHFYPWWWADDSYDETQLTEADLLEEERTLMHQVGLELRQIQFWRNKRVALRHNFAEKYPSDDVTCFLTSGRQFFDVQVLRDLKMARMNEVPLETHANGEYIVYAKRIPGRRYIIGADPAEGKLISTDNPDFSAAVVLDLDTAEEVASYRCRIVPEDFARELHDIGAYWNNALIAVERNVGASTIFVLEKQMMYPNIYYFPDRDWMKERKMGTQKRQIIRIAGFPTSDKYRRWACNELAKEVRTCPEFWKDKTFIDEALKFVYDEKGKPCAMEGAHDDTVSARWIAVAARAETLGFWDPTSAGWQDYGDTGEDE